MDILVTGGAGFIGGHLVRRLVSEGHQVRVLDALVPQVHGPDAGWPAGMPETVECVRGDVADVDTWRAALDGAEMVYHLAAEVGVGQSMYEVVRYVQANTLGTAIFLDLLATGEYPLSKVVVASSMSIYGEGSYTCPECGPQAVLLRPNSQLELRQWEPFCPGCGAELVSGPTNEDKPLQPTSVYAITKRDQEELCLSIGRAYDIPTVALRFFNVYGPGQSVSNPYTGVVAIFSSRLLNGNAPMIFEDGLQTRDFIYVEDLVQGLILAGETDKADYQALNLGSGGVTSILDVALMLNDELGLDIEPQLVGRYRSGDIRHCYADISRARELLGFEPAVSLSEGIRRTIPWLREQSAVDRVEEAQAELATRGLTR